MSKTTKRFSSDFETLQDGFVQLREDVSKLLGSAAGTAKSGAGAIKERAVNAVEHLKESGGDKFDELGEKIGRNPVRSVAIALGVGFLLAKFMSRR